MAIEREMATENPDLTMGINGVEIAQDVRIEVKRRPESVFLKRNRRRRLDLRTLAGTARESGKIYRQLVQNEISAAEAEIRSRVLRRHAEVLTSLEQKQQLVEIQEQLRKLQDPQGLPVFDSAQLDGVGDEVPK